MTFSPIKDGGERKRAGSGCQLRPFEKLFQTERGAFETFSLVLCKLTDGVREWIVRALV